MEEEAPRKRKFLRNTLIVVGVVIAFAALAGAGSNGSTNNQSTDGTTDSSDLNTQVVTNTQEVEVTNKEGSDWQDCLVGFNGGTGWGFDNPPYQTRTPLTIPAGQTITIPYDSITADDGTRFDYSTHAINSIVVDCGKGTVNERSWVGTLK